MPSLYKVPVTCLKRVGPKKAELFHKLGVDTVGELLRVYPRTYEDWSNPLPIAEAADQGVCVVRATVERRYPPARIRGNMILYKVLVTDGTDYMQVTLFNQRFVYEGLKMDGEYLFHGQVKSDYSGYVMSAPGIASPEQCRIRPVYSQSGALTGRQIEDAMVQAVRMLPPAVNDPIPEPMDVIHPIQS